MRDLILDTETTGLNPKEHRIVELACVEMVNRIETGRSWQWYFNPQRAIDAAATKVHGLTAEFLRDKPLFAACAQEIAGVLEGAHLVIHNAPFDIGFINAEFDRCGHHVSAAHVTDTLALARRKHPGSPASLDALCKRYKIDNTARTLHGALLDCQLLAEVYIELTGGRQASLELMSHTGDITTDYVALKRQIALPPRITAAELSAHAAMVAGLGVGAIWRKFWARSVREVA